jgi:cell division GTPase FtsZ
MNQDTTLVIGSGQTGTRLASIFSNKYKYTKRIFFNTNNDDDISDIILLNSGDNKGGSGRNPEYTMSDVMPRYEEKIKKSFIDMFEKNKDITNVVLMNSLGGGSGSGINYWILKNILIPYRKERNINIISVVVLPIKFEGNPANSNSLVMMNMYYSLSKDVSIIPVDNNFLRSKFDSFEDMNNHICEIIYRIINYDSFVGTSKTGGLGTLDENEVERICQPNNGFLSYYELYQKNIEDIIYSLNQFDPITCKSLIVLFKTPKDKNVSIETLNHIDKLFTNQVKILAESEGKEFKIEFICNGINLPSSFEQDVDNVISKISNLKESKSKDKQENKQKVAKATKNLLKI